LANIALHGGIAFLCEYDARVWLKRAMFDAAVFGSARRHRSFAFPAFTGGPAMTHQEAAQGPNAS